ncbi:MAG: alpha/beta hydrolase [Porticoccaceae bacterium]
MATWKEETVKVAGSELVVVRGGSGKPLLVLHDEMGYTGWMGWNEELAKSRELIIPLQPGFGKSPRLDWAWRHRDVANFYQNMIRELNLGKVDLLGFSAGGYIAAEMAAANPEQLASLTLVGPMGIKPDKGEIYDMFACTINTYLRTSVASQDNEFKNIYGGEMTPEQFELFEDARAESARIGWEPYMFNPSLPWLLRSAANVKLPTLLIRGSDDGIVPEDCIRKYKEALPQAQVVSIAGAGHRVEIEKKDEFVAAVKKILA